MRVNSSMEIQLIWVRTKASMLCTFPDDLSTYMMYKCTSSLGNIIVPFYITLHKYFKHINHWMPLKWLTSSSVAVLGTGAT